jgi:hypothetical protein
LFAELVGHFWGLAVREMHNVARVAVYVVVYACESFLHGGFSG